MYSTDTGWPRSYSKYILQITQPSQYRYAKLQYIFAVTSVSPSMNDFLFKNDTTRQPQTHLTALLHWLKFPSLFSPKFGRSRIYAPLEDGLQIKSTHFPFFYRDHRICKGWSPHTDSIKQRKPIKIFTKVVYSLIIMMSEPRSFYCFIFFW